jgi:hypothetical protein
MPNTYTLIQSVTVGSGGAASIEFGSIPQTYTDLVVVVSARSTRPATANNDDIIIEPNGATTSLSARYLVGTGSAVASGTDTKILAGYMTAAGATASVFGNSSIYIPNYAGSTNKSFSSDGVSENNATAVGMAIQASLWSSTVAITSLVLKSYTGNNFAQYSSASLYGIKNS